MKCQTCKKRIWGRAGFFNQRALCQSCFANKKDERRILEKGKKLIGAREIK